MLTGQQNTAFGWGTLANTETGQFNVGVGSGALAGNNSGNNNVAVGTSALTSHQSGVSNVAIGANSLPGLTSGDRNIAIGFNAGFNDNFINDTINIGGPGIGLFTNGVIQIGTNFTHAKFFAAGIRGVTTGVADALTVVIDSQGQLGTVSSSRRYKFDIRDMDDVSDGLMRLRPVTFRYNHVFNGGAQPLQYGLIAEEVADIFPDLVVFNEDGLPETVQYRKVNAMLLNEVQRLNQQNQARIALIDELRAADEARRRQIDDLTERLAALEEMRGSSTAVSRETP